MGSSLSRIYDDYDAYEELCKTVKAEALGIRDSKSFYLHEKELMQKYGYQKTYFGYKKIKLT